MQRICFFETRVDYTFCSRFNLIINSLKWCCCLDFISSDSWISSRRLTTDFWKSSIKGYSCWKEMISGIKYLPRPRVAIKEIVEDCPSTRFITRLRSCRKGEIYLVYCWKFLFVLINQPPLKFLRMLADSCKFEKFLFPYSFNLIIPFFSKFNISAYFLR